MNQYISKKIKNFFWVSFFVLGFLMVSSSGEASKTAPVQEVKAGSLSSWIIEDPKSPVISISFSFNIGSAFDPRGKEGLAMLYSSLFLEDRKDWKKSDFLKELEVLGVQAQAWCRAEYLNFHWEFPAENREAVAKLIARLLKNAQFEGKIFERHRDTLPGDVIITYTDSMILGSKVLMSLLFPDHPYGRSVNGTPEGVQAITLKDLEVFAREKFSKDRLHIAMAGAVTPQICKALMATCFDGLVEKGPALSLPPVVWGKVPENPLFIEKHMAQCRLVFGQPAVSRSHPDWYALDLLNYVVGQSDFTSRLWVRLRDQLGLTYGVGTSLSSYADAGFLAGTLLTDKKTLQQCLDEVRQIWVQIYESGITARELEDAKSQWAAQIVTVMTNSTEISSLLLSIKRMGLPIDYLEKRSEIIQRVTLEEVNRVAKKYFDPKKLFVIIIGELN